MNPGFPQRIRRGWIRFRLFGRSRPQLARTAIVAVLLLAMLCGFALAASTWGDMNYASQPGLPSSATAQTSFDPMRQL
jgi:hypothetical protein